MYSRERLLSWLEPGQPLVRICLWPLSLRASLLQTLLDEPGAQMWSGQLVTEPPAAEERGSTALLDRLTDSEARIHVVADAGRVDLRMLDEVARQMPTGARLVLLTDRLEDWGPLPLTTVLPWQACLSPAEVKQLFGDSHGASVAYDLTEGWAGPTEWLARRGGDPDRFSAWLDGPELSQKLAAHVFSGLSESELFALRDLAWAGWVDPEDWRQMVVDEPQRLAAFEQIYRRRAWLVPEASGWRLPRVLSRCLRNRFPASSEQKRWTAAGLREALDIARLSRFDRLLERQDSDGSEISRKTRPGGVETAGRSEAEGSEIPSLRLEALGPPRVLRRFPDGLEEEVSWRLRRSFRCVAYLALAPEHARSKSAMVEDLWRDEAPEAADRNFHPTLSDARKTLGSPEAIVYLQGTYRLGSALGLSIDADEMRWHWDEGCRLLEQGDAVPTDVRSLAIQHFQAAWALYRGPLMQDFEDAWLEEPREELRRLYVGLLRRLADLAMDLGRMPLALDALRSLLITEPFDEEAHVAVMEIYGRSGRRDLVRRQFVHLQDQLKELRVEPSREAVSAYNRWMG